jgi:hypothetical protein
MKLADFIRLVKFGKMKLMQVFEFHFNPKLKEDLIFESFCYEPENIYEKRLGSLYMVGLLKNVLPQHSKFLDNLAKLIKENYYRPTLHSPEKSFKESLRQANEFLEKIAKAGEVKWLGNLSFATLSLKDFELHFTKVGGLKFFLLRGEEVIDIDRKLRFQEIEPYPLKIFGNIISGKLAENDIVLVLTEEVVDFFQSQNLLNEIAKIIPSHQNFAARLKEIFDAKREELAKISGICLLIFLSKEILAKKREAILPQPEKFSFKKVFSPAFSFIKKLIKKPSLPPLKVPKLKIPHPTFPKPAILRPAFPKIIIPNFFKLRKNLILILVLIFFLALGSFISQKEKEQQLKIYQATLNQIQEKTEEAENFLILKDSPAASQKANELFREAWEEISPLTKIASTLPQNLRSQISSLENEISQNLYQLNKLIEIAEPELLFEFNSREFIPQKIIFSGDLYFFSPYSQNLFKVNEVGEGTLIEKEEKFNLAVSLGDSILFFSKPNQLVNFKDGQFSQTISLEEPYPDFDFNNFSSYKSNLYFLDKKSGEIIKYPYLKNFEWNSPQLWLDSQTKKAIGGKSIAVDGSIWVLNKDSSISRYYAGNYQETLKLDLFPEPKDFSKIFTLSGLSYLYILEPAQSRIIILNKSGEVVKQFQSKKFDNLLDFAVSEDSGTIWLLNGFKIYQITF